MMANQMATMQISDDCHIWWILDSLPLSYSPLVMALCVQKDKTIDYIEKAIIKFEVTLKKPPVVATSLG